MDSSDVTSIYSDYSLTGSVLSLRRKSGMKQLRSRFSTKLNKGKECFISYFELPTSIWFRSVVVITFALHAKGHGFEPRRNLIFIFQSVNYVDKSNLTYWPRLTKRVPSKRKLLLKMRTKFLSDFIGISFNMFYYGMMSG